MRSRESKAKTDGAGLVVAIRVGRAPSAAWRRLWERLTGVLPCGDGGRGVDCGPKDGGGKSG